MPKAAATEALIAEMTAPQYADRTKSKKARGAVVPVVGDRITQATTFLRLHAAFVDDESDLDLKAMSEELRQTYIAIREHAAKLDAAVHRLSELDEQIERIHARFIAAAKEKGYAA